jgi:DNA-binding transcriptional MerR regulator
MSESERGSESHDGAPTGTEREQMGRLLEIGAAARELDVAASTLRTWERRYRLVVPRRGRSGQRLYAAEEMTLLRGVVAEIRRGVRAGAAHRTLRRSATRSSAHVTLVPSPTAPRLARRALDSLREQRLAFALPLVVSELVADAVARMDAADTIDVDVDLLETHARVRVRSGGVVVALARFGRKDAPASGLAMVDALVETWALESGPLGTTVTVSLPYDA